MKKILATFLLTILALLTLFTFSRLLTQKAVTESSIKKIETCVPTDTLYDSIVNNRTLIWTLTTDQAGIFPVTLYFDINNSVLRVIETVSTDSTYMSEAISLSKKPTSKFDDVPAILQGPISLLNEPIILKYDQNLNAYTFKSSSFIFNYASFKIRPVCNA